MVPIPRTIGAERLACVDRKGFGSFTDYMIESSWALLENIGLVFKESSFSIPKVLVFDIVLQIDVRLTA